MQDQSPSTTAMATARMRSIHTATDPQPLISDPWGSKLAAASTLGASLLGEEFASTDETTAAETIDTVLRASPAYAHVVLRSAYTEDALQSAMAAGVNQYVIIGAGYDSYALRRPVEAQGLEIFEIDHPSTQSMKKQQLAEHQSLRDDKLHFIAADLGKEAVDSALSRSPYKSDDQAFLSWLGVTMYLTREANMAALKSVAQYCAPGSQLVFTYINQSFFDAETTAEAEDFAELEQTVKSVGEPFVSGFHPESLGKELGAIGLELEEDLDDTQILARFDPSNANDLKSAARSHIARVRVI